MKSASKILVFDKDGNPSYRLYNVRKITIKKILNFIV